VKRFFKFINIPITALMVVIGIRFADFISSLESDPVHISSIGHLDKFYGLAGGDEFEFVRDVCITKDVTITVHREFQNLFTPEKYMLPSIDYVGLKEDGCNRVIFSGQVPTHLPPGMYEYRPVMIYRVNQSLKITKPAPPVQIEIVPWNEEEPPLPPPWRIQDGRYNQEHISTRIKM
jgi:hypothetical protein